MDKAYNNIEFEDLTPDLEIIADVCGIEATRKLIEHASGHTYYIPKLSKLKGFCLEYVKKNKDETNFKIARNLECSTEYIVRLRKLIDNE